MHLIELRESHRMASQKTSPDGSLRGVSGGTNYRNSSIVALTIDAVEEGDDEPLLSPFQGTKPTTAGTITADTITPAAAAAAAAAIETVVPVTAAAASPWISALDPASGKIYYFNTVTGNT